jgi:hypothetical protein
MSRKLNITSESEPGIPAKVIGSKAIEKFKSVPTKQAQSVENEEDHQQIIVNADYHTGLRGFNFNDEVQDRPEAEAGIDVALHNREDSDHWDGFRERCRAR